MSDKRALWEAYLELFAEGRMPIDLVLQLRIHRPDQLQEFFDFGFHSWQRFGNVKIGPIKFLGDGSLGAWSAGLNEPYSDKPDTCGCLYWNKMCIRDRITQGVISIILVLLRNLDQLTTLVVFLGMIGSLLGVAGVLVNRIRFPELERPYKVWGGAVTVVISTLIFAGLMVNNFIEDPVMSILGLVIVPIIGAVIYIYYDRKNKKSQ